MYKANYYVYILTNQDQTMFYTGMTDDLIRRNLEHKHEKYDGFTKKYNVKKLVYFEVYKRLEEAMKREQQIKRWRKHYKVNAINEMNVNWIDLANLFTNGMLRESFLEEIERTPAYAGALKSHENYRSKR